MAAATLEVAQKTAAKIGFIAAILEQCQGSGGGSIAVATIASCVIIN